MATCKTLQDFRSTDGDEKLSLVASDRLSPKSVAAFSMRLGPADLFRGPHFRNRKSDATRTCEMDDICSPAQ
jgi:hypothetical protein